MYRKKGFTLLELLAVIIVLGIIMVIAVPLILNYIKTAKERALLETGRNIIKSVQLHYADKTVSNQIYYIKDGKMDPPIPMSGKVSGTGFLEIDSYRDIRLQLTEKDVCVKKQFADVNVILVKEPCDEKPDTVVNLDKTGAAVPQLDTSMVPIRWEGNHWVKADKENTSSIYQWYDYNEGMWANMAIVKSKQKSKYLNAPLGYKINEEDIVGYFVGIPTFVYSLKAGSSERSFDVKFTQEEVLEYNTHPAFTWGSEKVTGFWFGKYELSGSTEHIFVLPNKSTLKNTSLIDMYKSIETLNGMKIKDEFNSSISEIHLVKNTEWGAVTVLSQSQYGVCKNKTCNKVEKNATWNTGYADKNSPYDSLKGMKTSTTGNIYGVYDMNGGTWEFTMGTNNISTLKAEISEKKYDSYTNKGIKGDLTTEDGTNGWYGSTASFLNSYQNWFIRGGDVNTPDSSLFWYRGDGISGGFRNGFRIAYALQP